MQIYKQELSKYSEPERAVKNANIAVEKYTPMLLDILAVERTLELLEKGGKKEISRAVKEIYFTYPEKPLRRGEISERVRRLSINMPASEKTIYYWLKEARLMCASLRGLRT